MSTVIPTAMTPQSSPVVSETLLILLVSSIHFINIVDFMVLMPLGPDLAHAFGTSSDHNGLLTGSYSAMAALSAIVGAFFLDRFDRRLAVIVALTGLVLGTIASALAFSFTTMLIARAVAGTFGGIAASVSLAMIIDCIPAERRGRAMGIVMSAFSISAVFGIPIGLELARISSWHVPFVMISMLGVVVILLLLFLLPPMRGHLQQKVVHSHWHTFKHLITTPKILLAYVITCVALFGNFLIVPNLSAYLQFNLHYPREHLGTLYMVGGLLSFFGMQLTGRLIDRWGCIALSWTSAVMMSFTLVFGFIMMMTNIPVIVLFTFFMFASTMRAVLVTSTISHLPAPQERAGFMSLNSAIQHGAMAIASMLSSALLQVEPNTGSLIGVPTLAELTLISVWILPILLMLLVKKYIPANYTAS